MRKRFRRPKTLDFSSLPRIAFPLGFGPLLGPDPRVRSRPRLGLSHFSPKPANIGPKTANFSPKTANIGPKTANLGPKSSPTLPT